MLNQLREYSDERLEKFIGLAMPTSVARKCSTLCSRLWSELDVIPLVLPEESNIGVDHYVDHPVRKSTGWELKSIDEQAESMGRKCVRYVLPSLKQCACAYSTQGCLALKTFRCCKSVSWD